MRVSAFDEQQMRDGYPPGIENHYWNSARNHIIHSLIKKYAWDRNIILEIGCGAGIVVDYLRDKHVEAFGADLSSAGENSDYLFYETDFRELDIGFAGRIEVVLILDVIEHMEDPSSFLGDILAKFTNLIGIIVTVPSRKELWSNFDEYYGHVRRYEVADLSHTLINAGLRLVELRHMFRLLYVPAYLMKILGTPRSVILRAPKKLLLHKIASLLLRSEYRLKHLPLPGTSLVAVGFPDRSNSQSN